MNEPSRRLKRSISEYKCSFPPHNIVMTLYDKFSIKTFYPYMYSLAFEMIFLMLSYCGNCDTIYVIFMLSKLDKVLQCRYRYVTT